MECSALIYGPLHKFIYLFINLFLFGKPVSYTRTWTTNLPQNSFYPFIPWTKPQGWPLHKFILPV